MTNCSEVLRHLNLFLDSECDPEANLAISEHLESCSVCSQRFAREKRLEEKLAARLGIAESGDAAIWRALHAKVARRSPRPRWALAAGILLAVTVAGGILHHRLSGHAPSDLVHAVCADHSRVLEGAHPAEVVDTWEAGVRVLHGHLPFSLAWAGQVPQQLHLTGARSCTLRTQPVALFTAQLGDRPVSVAVLPAEALRIFPETSGEFARKGDTFSCGDGAYKVGLARSGGTLVCVTGEADGEVLKGLASTLAEGLTVTP